MSERNMFQFVIDASNRMTNNAKHPPKQNLENYVSIQGAYNKGYREGCYDFCKVLIEELMKDNNMCKNCRRHIGSAHDYSEYCAPCLKAQATEGVSPNKITVER